MSSLFSLIICMSSSLKPFIVWWVITYLDSANSAIFSLLSFIFDYISIDAYSIFVCVLSIIPIASFKLFSLLSCVVFPYFTNILVSLNHAFNLVNNSSVYCSMIIFTCPTEPSHSSSSPPSSPSIFLVQKQ